MISIQNVTKNYGRKVAVDNLSLEIAPGEFFAVLGHNGAGKTTTIKMLAGLLRPTSGKLMVGGVDVAQDPIAAKKVSAYVPDQPFLYDKLSGIELTEAYSHGMKQRLVLAATLLHKPKVIMVDEPLVGLDPHTARLVKQVFKEQAKAGTSIFMSTHVLSVAEDFADRIGIMTNGKLVALGKMDDLRRQAQLEGKLEDVFFKITEGAVNPYE
jgi:ABC-2 type transport system ATP-binding protein